MVGDLTIVTLREIVKKVQVGTTQAPFKKDYNHRSSFAHEVYRHRNSLCNYARKIKKNLDTDPILKWVIVKKKNAENINGG